MSQVIISIVCVRTLRRKQEVLGNFPEKSGKYLLEEIMIKPRP
jgi:hypothetical protein